MQNDIRPTKTFSVSEFRQELGIPLIVAKRLINWGWVNAIKVTDGTIRITESEVEKTKIFLKNPWKRFSLYIKTLGPGLITGASDDDPGGIGTYSIAGAKYGLNLLWMAVWLLPMMIAIQETCARIGIVTNKGLVKVLKNNYNKFLVAGIVVLLIAANIFNIGADLGAMASSLNLLLPINFTFAAIIFTVFIIAIEILLPYQVYARILKWLTLSVFAYIIAGIIIKPDWFMILKNAIIPHLHFDKAYIFAIIAIFGTTITPYLFFWETSEEVEENSIKQKITQKLQLRKLHFKIARMRTDVNSGMILANLVFFFIIVTCSQVLFKNGINDIQTAQQAAEALRPLAGNYAFLLFALGIIGTGLLAVPVLAGSGAYALAELMKWREGLNQKFSRAKGFYLVITISVLIGLLMNFFGINSIKMLYYSAWFNGIICIPLILIIMIVGNNKKIMGKETHPLWIKIFGWWAFIFAALSAIALIILH